MTNLYTTKVELSISCTKLSVKDTFSKSDPICAIYQKIGKDWIEIARTEAVKNTRDPNFSKKIQLDYHFEELQSLKFAIHDVDNSSAKLSDDDFLGKIKCSLGQIVASKTYETILLQKKKKVGHGHIKDVLGKSDGFLEFWKNLPDGSWVLAHRTEVIKNSLNPVWRPFSIALHALCGAKQDAKIKVQCHDWDSDGSHDLIGEFYTTLAEIEKTPVEFDLINPKKKDKKKYKNSGKIHITSSKVGVDFTGSNGDPRSPQSLHFMDPQAPNEYQQALWTVGNVVQDYDTDKLFPAFGFGAKIPPNEEVYHEFALNFNPQNPFCAGINGIMQAYQAALPRIKLWGPTNISPIINHVARFAYDAQNQQTTPENYYILLILTDGVITDMNDTKNAIVNASNLPMSIIIVGVGKADFSAMSELDGDDGVLKSVNGQPVARDIVQFVPFHMYKNNPAHLAKAVLAEVPSQVTKYFKQRNMAPGTPPPQQQQQQQ